MKTFKEFTSDVKRATKDELLSLAYGYYCKTESLDRRQDQYLAIIKESIETIKEQHKLLAEAGFEFEEPEMEME